MHRKIIASLGTTFLLASVAQAEEVIPPVVNGGTYVQHQITVARQQHPEIASIEVTGVPEGTAPIVLGSTASASRVMQPASASLAGPGASWSSDKRLYTVRKAYVTSSGLPIGTIAITFNGAQPGNTARFDAVAEQIAGQMQRATFTTRNTVDPWPFDPKFGPDTQAQVLVEKFTAKYPELLVMVIHATPPGSPTNVMIGSNIGRFGKVADADDLRVIDQGQSNLEISPDKKRFETELPLNDASGTRIGALGLVFNLNPAEDKEALHRHGLAIRDELAAHIPNNASLFAKR